MLFLCMSVPEVSQNTLWYDQMLDKIFKTKEYNESFKLATPFQETSETSPKTSGNEASESST